MKSRLKPLQATCRPHTDKQVIQFSSHCHTNLHKLWIRRTPPGHCFRLPCPFSPRALCPMIISKLLDSVHYPPDTALRAQLTLLRFTAKPHVFANRCSTKETALMWAHTAFSVFLKAGGTIPCTRPPWASCFTRMTPVLSTFLLQYSFWKM